ncbi:MAG: DNA polymerase III subunit delta [Pedobacter sp.]|nr:MAG: DNA polymerase III subunit delta [Pedobacter sp.]
MSAADLIKELKSRKYRPVYLLHGQEPYYIDIVVNYLENNVLTDMEKGFNQTIVYGKDSDLSTILNAAKRYPMMSEFQLIIVKEAQDLKWSKESEGTGSEMEALLHYLENPVPSTILVFAHKYALFDKRKKVFKAFGNKGVVFQSDSIREQQIMPWVENYIKEKGYAIQPQAASLMAEYLGTDLSKISNEIDKLCLNVSSSEAINTDDIQRNIGISKDFNVFELQKALTQRNAFKSFQIVDYFGNNPKANPLVLVLASLNSFFTKVLKYHYLPNKSDAAKVLGLNPYFVKDYEIAARAFPYHKTIEVISHLRTYDLKSKGVDSTNHTSEGDLLKELIFKILN